MANHPPYAEAEFMLQVSLWHTDMTAEGIKVRAHRKNPDPFVIALTIGHEVTVYMDQKLAGRVEEALRQLRVDEQLTEWMG